MKIVCSNCGKEFPPGTKLDSVMWVCTGQCYLAWFERHFGRPIRTLERKAEAPHEL